MKQTWDIIKVFKIFEPDEVGVSIDVFIKESKRRKKVYASI